MKKTELNMEQVRAIQLEMLRYIQDILVKNNIEFWLDGGTMLGCVRHKGYIPWDDDIDIIIRRKDYAQALYLLNEKSQKYQVFSMHNNSDYYYLFAKLVDTESRLIEHNLRSIENLGVYIDIFPLDFVPDDSFTQRQYYYKLFKLRSIVYYATLEKERLAAQPLKGKLKHYIGKLYGWRKALMQAEKLCISTSKKYNKYVVDATGIWKKNAHVAAETFASTVFLPFEGRDYPVPSGYDVYLTSLYGDYMKLPPIENRVLKHNFKAYRL